MLDRAGSDDPYGKFAWNAIASGAALLERWSDESADVRDAVLATSRDPERGLSLEGIRAVGEALAGRPVDAIRVAAGVRHAAAAMSILHSELALAEAIARRELGDRASSMLELELIVETPSEPAMYCRVLAALELVAARVEDSDLGAALRVARPRPGVGRPRQDRHRPAQLVRTGGNALGARQWCLDDAWTAAESIDDPFWGPVSRGRVLLERDEPDSASDVLASAEPRCVRHEVILGLLRARSNADSAEALTLAADALAPGELEPPAADRRLRVPRLDGARGARGVVRSRAVDGPAPAGSDTRRWSAAVRRRHQIEQLTQRERDVLRFLPSRLTLREIAGELYVSVNTLKFHLRVIYRKLGVNSREEAAALARSMTSVRPTRPVEPRPRPMSEPATVTSWASCRS